HSHERHENHERHEKRKGQTQNSQSNRHPESSFSTPKRTIVGMTRPVRLEPDTTGDRPAKAGHCRKELETISAGFAGSALIVVMSCFSTSSLRALIQR